MDFIDCVVAGGGVVGVAIARALALRGVGVVVLEKNARPGQETSARNSEVIHAGLYYPTGSLKARLCISGREMLLDYLAGNGIAHALTGKLVVAAEAQRAQLEAIGARAQANGVTDLVRLARRDIEDLENEVRAEYGLLSPRTGIFDSGAFLLSLVSDIEANGGMIVTNTRVCSIARSGNDLAVTTQGADGEDYTIACRYFINAAGHGAEAVARAAPCDSSWRAPRIRFARGLYFGITGPAPFRRLVYPVPEPGGLGIHSTLGLDGTTRFGPDVEWIDAPSYSMDASRAERFARAISAYWPAVAERELHPLFAGVRPKLSAPGEPDADFLIAGPQLHRTDGIVHLLGIESPGLTSSLAIADEVVRQLGL
ncbi:NAD(P)/FAD-dependent oxidoreductase [Gellertiella hungarica]|uniref:L-2-hydroxyglutarate oxidase LhgO n=1 Tax=Gellertiella hungarica TaxID=1572859 RepID=A0A7W6NJX9_9HYPH|nr:NAD(P)/FAD-dependent oxidoreductase [Gellertiella hungarica]MBB4063939.1 L-2-hydroxyglutarate oxidase LhgO [Gellertiella hungarica]